MKGKTAILLRNSLAIIISLFVLNIASTAQEGYFGQEIRISASNAICEWPCIAANMEDVLLIVYSQEAGSRNDIYYSVSTNGGANWSTPLPTGSANEWCKSIYLDPDEEGNFHMAYSDGASSFSREIYYRSYNPTTDVWSPRVRLSQSAGNCNWCNISVDGDQITVIWYQELGGNLLPVIYIKTATIGEAWPSEPEDVAQNPTDGHIYPSVKAVNGNIYAIWQLQKYAAGASEPFSKAIWFREKRDGVWLAALEVGKWAWPDIEVDSYGDPHCIYPESGNVNYRCRINDNWHGQVRLNTSGSVDGFFDMDYRNDTLVACFQQGAANNPGERDSSYFRIRRKNPNTENWGNWEAPVELDSGGDSTLCRVFIDSQGFAHFTWADWGSVTRRDPDCIYYNKWKVCDPDAPSIQLSKTSLSFTAPQGEDAGTKIFKIRNSGPSELNYTLTANQDWITLSKTSGTVEEEWDEISVSVDTNIEVATHTGKITVTSDEADNSPREIHVTLKVDPPPIFAPQNFTGVKEENKTVFIREIVHHLSWEAHPDNKDIAKYIITCTYTENGISTTKIFEVNASQKTFDNRMVTDDVEYTYIIKAEDDQERQGQESEPVTIR
ncbi:MAG: BACON domain-containing protein [Candidatus Aminicenantes bacterium]|nr:BACON domain-containing protein [Candidatus Aminicenantes bacterium]